MEKEPTNKDLAKLIDTLAISMAKGFSSLEEKMATKEDFLKLQVQINDVQTDLKSFKKETQENFDNLNEKFDDSNDTIMNHDKRIEKLETKVFHSVF